MRIALLAVSLLAVSAPAIAAKQYLDVTALPDQQSRMNLGVEMVESDQPQSSVRIFEPDERASKRVAVQIMAFNAGDQPFNFGPENITVETVEGLAVAVIPYDKLVKEEKSRRTWAAIGMALAAGANSYNASQAGYSYGTVNAYGSGGWASAHYTGYNAGQAYAAQSIANAQNQAMYARFSETSAEALEGLKVNMRTTTIDPGQEFGGQVMIELPPNVRRSKAPVELIVHVRAGSESHLFSARIVRR